MDMKQCPHCGKQLPADAALCPACMTELIERTVVPLPKQRPKWLLSMAGVLVLVIAVVSILVLPERADPNIEDDLPPSEDVGDEASNGPLTNQMPQAEDTTLDEPPTTDTPQEKSKPEPTPDHEVSGTIHDNSTNHIIYSDGEDTFYVTSHFIASPDPFYPQKETSQYFSMSAGAQRSGEVTTQSRVTVWDGKDYNTELRQCFWNKVESFQVIVSDIEGADVISVKSSQEDTSDQTTAYVADIGVLSFGQGQICWEFLMKNGDLLRLYTHIQVEAISEVELRPTAVEVPNMASLQAYIDNQTAGLSAKTVVCLYLPDITYVGNLVLTDNVFRVYGAAEGPGVGRTVLKGSLTLNPEPPQEAQIQNIDFKGIGGTGVIASKGVTLYYCSFSGYDVAVDWLDQAWVRLQGCTFQNNQVAMRVNNNEHNYSNCFYPDNIFENNGIALQFQHLTCDEPLDFAGSQFKNNDTDIDNATGIALDTSGAIFE